jgi:hypothetical protein
MGLHLHWVSLQTLHHTDKSLPSLKGDDNWEGSRTTDGSNTYLSVDRRSYVYEIQQTIGNQGVQQLIHNGIIQTKLTVSHSSDIYEEEADRVADRVMRMAVPLDSVIPVDSKKRDGIDRKCTACKKEDEKELDISRKASFSSNLGITNEVNTEISNVRSNGGSLLDANARHFMESRFGHDFSKVRIHADERAARSARSVNALAYTIGNDIIFGEGQYHSNTIEGRRLLAHELTHVVQQDDFKDSTIKRVCSSAAVCAAPIPGSAAGFGASEEAAERAARTRRAGMSHSRQRSTGHVGHAQQLEIFFTATSASPASLSKVHGIFIDMDLSPGTGAVTMSCASMTPPITGATKPCIFVHGNLNQEAFAFNKTLNSVIGGLPREEWKTRTLTSLTHELEHVVFDTSAHGTPAGISTPTCTRANISSELSELHAQMSEFPVVFRAIPVGAGPTHGSRLRVITWFDNFVGGGGEDLRGIMAAIGCSCECAETNEFIKDTFNFATSSWTAAEKTFFNSEVKSRLPAWPL